MRDITFTIEAGEAGKALVWMDEHPCTIRGKYGGAIGGAFTFSFTDTSIGQIQTVKCACGAEHGIDTGRNCLHKSRKHNFSAWRQVCTYCILGLCSVDVHQPQRQRTCLYQICGAIEMQPKKDGARI